MSVAEDVKEITPFKGMRYKKREWKVDAANEARLMGLCRIDPAVFKGCSDPSAFISFAIQEGVNNSAPAEAQKFETDFRAKSGIGLWYPRAVNEMRMFAKAVTEAKSDEPKAVAAKLEGMKFDVFDGGEGVMRKDDHQFFQDMYIASFGALDAGAKFDEEGTGWGWKEAGRVKAADTVLPTTCKMERPN